ncbi:MAG: TIGR03915 family putative DNA repair protein [Saprospiraceae bacterium]
MATTQRQFLYDGSYEGLLSAIFESYRLRLEPSGFIPETEFFGDLFELPLPTSTNPEQAERVRAGLIRKTSPQAATMLYHAFLSEHPEVEMLIYRFIQLTMASSYNMEENFLEPGVLKLNQLNKQIGREVHRMHAFVRFQQASDGLFVAVIDPDFNVLPLLGDHFEKRYAAQSWMIYDRRRHYGLHYNQQHTAYITCTAEMHLRLQRQAKDALSVEEDRYQNLWKDYFGSVNIPERRNLKLHLQHVPKRYWKYLTEKY